MVLREHLTSAKSIWSNNTTQSAALIPQTLILHRDTTTKATLFLIPSQSPNPRNRMKSVSGKVSSSKPISLSKAAKILSNFVSVDNGASQALQVYLKRASSSFAELVQVHKDPKSSQSHRKTEKIPTKIDIHNQTLENAVHIKSSHSDRRSENQHEKIDIHNETLDKVHSSRKHKKHRSEGVNAENTVKDGEKVGEFDYRNKHRSENVNDENENRGKDRQNNEEFDEKRDNVEDSVRKRDKKAKKHKGIEKEEMRMDGVNRVKDQEKTEELEERRDNVEDSMRKRDKKAKKHKVVEREDEGVLGVEEEEEEDEDEDEERKEKKKKKKRKNREDDGGGELVLDSADQSAAKKKKKRKIEVEE